MSDRDAGSAGGQRKKPRKQEQEAASEEVTEVAKDVLRMQLPISMPGLGHVNCYAILDADGATVIDPGLPTKASFHALEQRLGQAGLRVEDVHTVLVTHSHPDHFGGAARIIDRSDAKLVAHRSFSIGFSKPEKPEVSVDDLHAHAEAEAGHAVEGDAERERAHAPFTPVRPKWSGRTPWGGEPPRPPFKMRMRYAVMRLIGRAMSFPTISAPTLGGDVLKIGGRELIVVHTPGHTEDHICLHDPAEEIFFAGDHVLPTITPHISGLTRNPDPLQAFFDSLDEAAALPHVSQVLPAHGHPFADLAARCEAIKRHHDERLDKVRQIARDLGPATVEAFMQRLFKERSWGGMAASETYAHLEHIRLLGQAESYQDERGQLVYSL
jgi:glyoxylase-like metal-dependent hydrolase (beta-lactamase superfamily II)